MNLETTFEANAEYTIKVGDNTLAITSIFGEIDSDTTLFTLADNKLTCVTGGKYRLTVLYNPTNSTCTVSIEVLKDSWSEVDTVGIEVYSYLSQAWNKTNQVKSLKAYYNSLSGQYKVYFSYVFVATESINFGLKFDGSWACNVKSWDVTFSVASGSKKVSSSLDTKNGAYQVGSEVGECFFELTFSVSGSSYNLISMTAGDSDTNPNT